MSSRGKNLTSHILRPDEPTSVQGGPIKGKVRTFFVIGLMFLLEEKSELAILTEKNLFELCTIYFSSLFILVQLRQHGRPSFCTEMSSFV